MKKNHELKWKASASAGESARTMLPPLVATLFESGRRVARDGTTPTQLHRFRLEVKRFRYTLELFRPCYGPGFEQKLKSLKVLQDDLGNINDCVSAIDLVSATGAPVTEKSRVGRFLEHRMAGLIGEFRQHWTGVFDAPGQQDRWVQYLKRFVKAETVRKNRQRRIARGAATRAKR